MLVLLTLSFLDVVLEVLRHTPLVCISKMLVSKISGLVVSGTVFSAKACLSKLPIETREVLNLTPPLEEPV